MLHLRTRALIALALGLALAGRARAESVDQLVTLLEKKPAGMSDDVWREKRRDAARELGRLNDKKAVPALIRIVEAEKFDAVAEISIDSLARLGDKRAVEPLKKVYNDPSRDKFMRDAAANALRRLGANPDAAAAPPQPEPEPEPEPEQAQAPTSAPAAAVTPEAAEQPEEEEEEDLSAPEGPAFGADVIAAYDRWTFAVGSFALAYDSIQRRPFLEGAASANWQLGRELTSFGWSLDNGLAFTGGAQDRDRQMPDTSSLAMDLQGRSQAEGRFYLTPNAIFGGLDAGLGLGLTAAKIETNMPGNADYEDAAPSATINLGLGAGYGRILDVGVSLRLRRIEGVLRRARLLGRSINGDVARRIFAAWWALSGELGSRRRLLATIQLLREAGVLLSEPPPSVTYEILRVLEDGQLDQRYDGFELRVGVGETFAWAESMPQSNDVELDRMETAYMRGRFGRQSAGGLSELVGRTNGVYRLTGAPGFWLAQADLTWRRFLYSSAWDPRGAVEIGVSAGISDLYTEPDEMPKLGPATRLAGSLAYVFLPNRASHLRLGVDLAIEDELLFVGARLEFSYGLLDSVVAPY